MEGVERELSDTKVVQTVTVQCVAVCSIHCDLRAQWKVRY